MINGWIRFSKYAASGAATLIGITMLANAWALDPCRAPTPCPCKADGYCRPNVLEWGHYRTRWRSWPGDVKQPGATPDAADPSQQQLELPPLERPDPQKENLRGPAKTTTDRAEAETGPIDADAIPELPQDLPVQPQLQPEQPFEIPGQPLDLPAEQPLPVQPPVEQPQEELPDFELQNFQDEMPVQLNDAPPALPTSLQHNSSTPSVVPKAQTKLIQPEHARISTVTSPQQPTKPIRLPQVASNQRRMVVQANVDMSKRLELVNPAAGNLMPETEVESAVYYESSDQPPSFPGS